MAASETDSAESHGQDVIERKEGSEFSSVSDDEISIAVTDEVDFGFVPRAWSM